MVGLKLEKIPSEPCGSHMMPLGYKSLSVESSADVPPHITLLCFTEDLGKVMTGLNLVHLFIGNNKHTGSPAKKAVS